MTDGVLGIRIAALLPDPLKVRLQAAVELLPGTIVWVTTGPHLLQLLRRHILSLVVVDPISGGRQLRATVYTLLRHRPFILLIVYTAITPASMRVVAALGRQGLREAVFTPYEDTPERFARTLRRVATDFLHGYEGNSYVM